MKTSFFLKNKFFQTLFSKKRPLINILTRTSGRPNGFKKCYESISKQSYKNIEHIVSYDTSEDLNYLNKYDVKKISVTKREAAVEELKTSDKAYEPYNLYCNSLMNEVENGWIMFLDDDDMLNDTKSISRMVREMKTEDEDTLFFWQTQFPNGTLRPPENIFKKRSIVYTRMDTACFMFHSKYKGLVQWDQWYGADFRFVKDLADIIPKQKWIHKVFTLKNNFGDHGNRNDLPE